MGPGEPPWEGGKYGTPAECGRPVSSKFATGTADESEAKALVWRQLPGYYLGRQLPGYLGCDVHANLWVCSYYLIAVVPMYINPHMRKGALLLTSA
jgi:hypothetical protein